MKKLVRVILVMMFVVISSLSVHAQATGDFRTFATGNWSDAATWETYDGSAWVSAASAPTGTADTIIIQSGHTVTIDGSVSMTKYIRNNGGTITVTGSLSFASGSTYELNSTTITSLPAASWDPNSTIKVTACTSLSTASVFAPNVHYGNMIWNFPSQAADGYIHGSTVDATYYFDGNVTVQNTGTKKIKYTPGGVYTSTLVIGGNLTASGGIVQWVNTGNAGQFISITVGGNITCSAATYLSSSSLTALSTNCTLQLTGLNSTFYSIYDWKNFKIVVPAEKTCSVDSMKVNSTTSIQIDGTLKCGTHVVTLGSSSVFTLSSGATLYSGYPTGINGNFNTSGTKTLSTGANYVFNGTTPQVTGALLPTTVNNLTINNSAGVTLSQNTTVNGVITLSSGLFNNTSSSITLGGGASVVITGGSSTVALPVELTSFSASVRGKKVDLQWNTATEVNNAGFNIERRSTAGEWSKIGFVEGNGTVNTPKSYRYTDNLSSAASYQYRLKQIDRDGKFEYSSSVDAVVGMTADDYQLSQNYPNPFNPSTSFTFAVQSPEHVTVKVFNLIGQEVSTLFNDAAQPNQVYTMKFDGTKLSSGLYFYTLRSNSRNETKKMLLNK